MRTAASALTSSRRAMAISGFCCSARSTACRSVSVCTSARSAIAHTAPHSNVKVLLSFDMKVLSRMDAGRLLAEAPDRERMTIRPVEADHIHGGFALDRIDGLPNAKHRRARMDFQ